MISAIVFGSGGRDRGCVDEIGLVMREGWRLAGLIAIGSSLTVFGVRSCFEYINKILVDEY